MDRTDRKILDHLVLNSRIAMSSLAKLVGMSAPSVAERVRHMEDSGIIKGFTVDLDYSKLGFSIEALVRIRPLPGQLHIVEKMIIEESRFTSCDKVTGEDCFVVRISAKNIQELDIIMDPFHERAATNTSIVKSSPIRNRQPK
ncbi:Lrp/AsnC family transcriptional regulator [Lentilitoribacter sp. EG35]|jgi:Lrp/AsnC family leucine-responsive transcriptional regulator|uniref:Lrp/AsnC family transcriptional regulator n=1 Tax=Lentilitoribacter sp. EG35 TaxID=3234192 RepID=UPI00345FE123